MERFPGVDFMKFDSLLSGEERLIRDTVRQFVDERVKPIIEQAHREAKAPMELAAEIGDLNLFGANFTEYGLPGLGDVAYGLVMQELERGDSGIRSMVSVQSSLVMYPILTFGSKEQKDRFIPGLASGRTIGCFGLTEPDFGSNPSAMRTRARRDGDDWVLNGAKQWITNGSVADVAVVWARTDEGIRGFLVEKGTEGFVSAEQKGKFSLRASVTGELSFQNCRIPKDNILPGSRGVGSALQTLNQARYGICWGGLGSAMECYHTALEYARQRVQFAGQPIASHQLVQEKLAWMITEITKGQFLAYQLAGLKTAGTMEPQHVSMCKRNNVWVARECAKLAREILGANGISDEYPVVRHMLNIESVYTYEGTHDIHGLVIGAAVTGIPSFNPPMTRAQAREAAAGPELAAVAAGGGS